MSSIRLGTNLFQKERVISDLQNENQQLKERVKHLEILTKQLEQEKIYFEKSDFESKNQVKLLEIQNDQLTHQNKQLKLEIHQMKEDSQKKEEVVKEKTLQAMYLEQDLEEVKSCNNIKTNKIENYQSEVIMQEKRNLKLEKMIESLQEKISQKENDIEILKKSIKQKDNHIAILLKEKEKSFKGVVDKDCSQKLIITAKSTQKENENLNIATVSYQNTAEQQIKYEDQLRSLKSKLTSFTKQLQDKENELKKIKDENFQLMTRLKNCKR